MDHHLFEYGVGLDGLRCLLIAFQMVLFRAVRVRLNVSMLLMVLGLGRLSRFALSVGTNSGQFMCQKLSFGVWVVFGEKMSRVMMMGKWSVLIGHVASSVLHFTMVSRRSALQKTLSTLV